MHIILLVLKIIGIILLVILAILLVLLLLILFTPIFYRAEGSYTDEKPYAKARIRFLFPVFQAFLSYKDGKPESKIQVFGICVRDFFNKKEAKAKKTKKSKKQKKTENFQKTPNSQNLQKAPPKESIPRVDKTQPSITTTAKGNNDNLSFVGKIKQYVSFLKEKILFIINKIKEWWQKGLDLKQKIKEIASKIKYYRDIWEMDVTKRAYAKAKKSLKRLFKSIKPRKGNLRIHFGTEDPAKTGEICAYFGMVYPFVGNYVMIEPDFEQKIFEGDFWVKGYITVFAVLRSAWIFLFDKDIKALKEILTNTDSEEDKHE